MAEVRIREREREYEWMNEQTEAGKDTRDLKFSTVSLPLILLTKEIIRPDFKGRKMGSPFDAKSCQVR